MKIKFTSNFVDKLRKIDKKDRRLAKKINERIKVFALNPNHHSLGLHKLTGELSECWGVTVEYNFRLVFYYSSGCVIFINLGTHDQVYRK